MCTVHYLSKAEHPYVKFTFGAIKPMISSNQNWILYIFLNNPRFSGLSVLQVPPDVVYIFEKFDSTPPIRIFTGLTYPYDVAFLGSNGFELSQDILLIYDIKWLGHIFERIFVFVLVKLLHGLQKLSFIA